MKLSKQDFNNLRSYIYKVCALAIEEDKLYLIRQRLEPLALSVGCESFEMLYKKLTHEDSTYLREKLITAITTNETFFFRDVHPFRTFSDYLLPYLAGLIRERKKRPKSRKGASVRIWCCASSTGQEPYSIAMLISEYVNSNMGISTDDFEILATDISKNVLTKAISGAYNDMEISRGLSQERKSKYFRKEGKSWVVSDQIQKMVKFGRINLSESFRLLGGFDIIFCRNVMIYFDSDTKQRIFDQFHYLLSDTGFLMLGASESSYGLSNKFKSIQHKETLIYQKI